MYWHKMYRFITNIVTTVSTIVIVQPLGAITGQEDATTGHLFLYTGAQMPSIGIGTWNALGDDARRMVEVAVETGYRSIDTAHIYGNEADVGQAIENKIREGVVNREDLFVTTKMWPDLKPGDSVEDRLRQSLSKLKLDYVDLYLIHFPSPSEENMSNLEMWNGMIDMFNKGLTKAIGVSNFDSNQMQELIDNTDFAPHNVQNRAHVYYNENDATLEYCKQHGITFTAYSPLGNPSWNKASPLSDAAVENIAEKHQRTPAQVLLRYLLQRGMAVIPKSTHRERIEENFRIFDFELPTEDIDTLSQLTEPAKKEDE